MSSGKWMAEITLNLPWSILFFLLWMWYRSNEEMQDWAYNFFVARLENPDIHLDREIYPDETGEGSRTITNYRHVVHELGLRVRNEYSGWAGLVTSGLSYLDNRGPEIRRDVRILSIYVIFV